MSPRVRLILVLGIAVLAVAGSVGFVVATRARQDAVRANAPTVPTRDDLAAVRSQPHLVFRSMALGAGYGQVAIVPLSAPGGARAFTPASCDRVYASATNAICLAAHRGLVTTYSASLLGPDWTATGQLPLPGLPSRARVSRDGSLIATTTFVHGDSYAAAGQFSTRTVVSRPDGSGVDLEQFVLFVDGRRITAVDRNVWGVTFADSDRFFATAASGGRTWLVEGSLSARTLTALRTDVECPSLSPDGSRVAFKKHANLPAGRWRLAVYDLRDRTETLLAEVRSVDDQAEWLDDGHILYGLARDVEGSASSDIWVVPADGSGQPRVLVADAWSPAVVR